MKLSRTFTAMLALGMAGAAMAQTPPPGPPAGPPPDPWGDATVSREESQAKAGAMFDGMDTDRNGTINEAEENAAVAAAGPAGRMIGGALHRADADGDGKLTRAEFLAAQQERFDRQDADKDGKVTKAERDAARAAMMQRRQQRGGGGGFGPPSPGEGGFGPPERN